MIERREVIVVGGGQAGLAMGWHLGRKGIDSLILDAAPELGRSWTSRWDSLELFTPAAYNGLPGMHFPGHPERLPHKDEVADYLRRYAEAFDLPVRLDARVEVLEPSPLGRGWMLTTRDGTYEADRVVVATGPFQRPRVPACAAELDPAVVQLHSSSYRRPDLLPEGPVLVVGGGNSGVQIARELARSGRPTTLAVGGRLARFPERIAGRSVFRWLDRVGAMDVPVTSRLGRRAAGREFLIGDGPRRIARRDGVALAGRVVACRGQAVLTADLQVLRPAAVVWSTGFLPDYGWIRGAPVFDAAGRPIQRRGVTTAEGLHFLGLSWLHTRGSGLLGWVGRDAAWLTDFIVESHSTIPSFEAEV